jgi:hypothetical protein
MKNIIIKFKNNEICLFPGDNLKKRYDVVIVGGGPSGIFSAIELTKKDNLDVLILEKGHDIDKRKCPGKGKKCFYCEPCAITCGWGGAGAFSDGKLNLSTKIGGWLDEYISKKELLKLIRYIDNIYLGFGAPNEDISLDSQKVEELKNKAKKFGLLFIPAQIRHLGTERCAQILKKMKSYISKRAEILTENEVSKILTSGDKIEGVVLTDETRYLCDYLILAPGREGSDWLMKEVMRLKLKVKNNAVDIGVRVEVPAYVMEPITDHFHESKLIYYSKQFDDQVRTFCMNPYGVVSNEKYGDVITVNGHSYAENKTENTNFALLVSTNFTEPFKEPIAYGKHIARLANMLGGGTIIQRLYDLKAGRRSTEVRIKKSKVKPTLTKATPGDLSFVLPYRHLSDIIEMLDVLDNIVPGVASGDTLLYGIETKFYSCRLNLSSNLETDIKNMYAIGDGAGVSRGLVHASISGVIAARDILKKIKNEKY